MKELQRMDSMTYTEGPTYTERPRLADDPLVSQLRTELKARGYVGLVMHRDDLSLYLMWFLGVLLGLTLAAGRN